MNSIKESKSVYVKKILPPNRDPTFLNADLVSVERFFSPHALSSNKRWAWNIPCPFNTRRAIGA